MDAIVQSWVDEAAHIPQSAWDMLASGESKMALTNEQFIEMGKAAMQALITCNDSIILTPDDVAERAWDIAAAMGRIYNARNPPAFTAQTNGGVSTSQQWIPKDIKLKV